MQSFRFLILQLFVFISITATAQNLEISDISEASRDLYARTHPRRDSNNELCAVLKIQVASVKNLSFVGNIVGDTEYTPGEYIVYVPANTKRMNIEQNGVKVCTVDFERVGIEIESQKTYKLVLVRPVRKEVVFAISPNDAKIEVNNQVISQENGTATFYGDVNKLYNYRITKVGYEDVEGSFLLSEKDQTKIIMNTLQEKTYDVRFESNVASADIYIDNEQVPSQENVFLTKGIHHLRATADKYYDLDKDILVSEDMAPVQLFLERMKRNGDVSSKPRLRFNFYVNAGLLVEPDIVSSKEGISEFTEDDKLGTYYGIGFNYEKFGSRFFSTTFGVEYQYNSYSEEEQISTLDFPIIFNSVVPLGKFNRNSFNIGLGPVLGFAWDDSSDSGDSMEDSETWFSVGGRFSLRLIFSHIILGADINYATPNVSDIDFALGANATIGWRF